MQTETAKLSTDNSHTQESRPCHHIDDPDLVLKAIREVVAKVKKPK